MRVGVLGGTFDPIHIGHVSAAEIADRAIGFERLLIVPSRVPPHRIEHPRASGYHRFAMAALTAAMHERWEASTIELESEDGLSYTASTLQRLHRLGLAAGDLYFIAGADAFADIATWKDYPRVLDLAHFAVVSRPRAPVEGLPAQLQGLAPHMVSATDGVRTLLPEGRPSLFLIDGDTPDVSSTDIRRRRAEGFSITGLVPPAVEAHILRHHLYEGGQG